MKGKNKKGLKQKLAYLISFAVSAYYTLPAYASSINDSVLVKGSDKLLKDSLTALTLLFAAGTPVMIIFFFLKRQFADDDAEKAKNSKNIKTTFIIGVGGTIAVAMFNVVLNYFK